MPGYGVGISPFLSTTGGGGNKGGGPNLTFESQWKTDNTSAGSSASDEVSLPLLSGGTYNFTVNWGDGNSDVITVWNQAETTHQYAAAGTYDVTITGTCIGWRFNNTGDRLKILDVTNWGSLEITTSTSFYGCGNFDFTATDAPTVSTTDMTNGFRDTALTTPNFSAWDFSTVNIWIGCFRSLTSLNGNFTGITISGNAFRMFDGCTSFTGIGLDSADTTGLTSGANMFTNCDIQVSLNSWVMSSCLNISNMLFNNDNYDFAFDNWDWTAIITANGFMQNSTGLSTSNYDDTLVHINSQAVNNNVNIHFGSSTYTGAGAGGTAHDDLIADHFWTINDGGPV